MTWDKKSTKTSWGGVKKGNSDGNQSLYSKRTSNGEVDINNHAHFHKDGVTNTKNGNKTTYYKSSSPKNKKSSGCFLTTACCEYMKLPDDCHQLTVLRQFRDTYLLENDRGMRLVSRYYDEAPALAEKLILDPKLVKDTWENINLCVHLIENKRYNDAIAQYETMHLKLKTILG